MAKPSTGTLVGALSVALLAGAVTIPTAASNADMCPDAAEYVAISNAWVHGAGFVDPVKWTNYLDTGVPFPASILRAPLPSILLAIPLSVGMGVAAVKAFHALLASLIIGGLVLFARRLMGLGAAIACALFVGSLQAWVIVSQMPMSDLLAIGAMLLIFATSARVAESVPMALACAASTLIAWATRPTLAALAGPLALVVLRQRGARAAWTLGGLPTYLGATTIGLVGLRWLAIALTGYSPYAGYGFMSEMLNLADPLVFAKRYVGALHFVTTHWLWIEPLLLQRAAQVAFTLFLAPLFSGVGWVAAPSDLYFLVAGRDERPRDFPAAAGRALVRPVHRVDHRDLRGVRQMALSAADRRVRRGVRLRRHRRSHRGRGAAGRTSILSNARHPRACRASRAGAADLAGARLASGAASRLGGRPAAVVGAPHQRTVSSPAAGGDEFRSAVPQRAPGRRRCKPGPVDLSRVVRQPDDLDAQQS
jgi:hypothetical protein